LCALRHSLNMLFHLQRIEWTYFCFFCNDFGYRRAHGEPF
jgi:hypothetical protein